MSRPSLPSRPNQDVTKISAAWLGKLLDCVIYAMDYPQGDQKTTRRNVDFIEVIGHSSGGAGGSGDTYAGPFMATDSSSGDGCSLTIYDGSDPDGSYAGWAQINAEAFQVESDYVNIPGTGWVYLQSEWDQAAEKPGVPVFRFSSEYPLCAENIFKLVLFKVTKDGNTITAVTRYHHGDIHGIIWGTCAYTEGQ